MPPAVIAAIIGGGSAIAGSAIAAHGNTSASKIAAQSADKSEVLQKEIYDQQRADLAPYRDLGLGALGQLRTGMGYPEASRATASIGSLGATPAPYVVPGAKGADGRPFPGANPNGPQEVPTPNAVPMVSDQPSPVQTLGSVGKLAPWAQAQTQTQSSYRRMQTPDGRIVNVPQAQVSEATAQGGKVIS